MDEDEFDCKTQEEKYWLGQDDSSKSLFLPLGCVGLTVVQIVQILRPMPKVFKTMQW